jgi:hypothetical protein
MTKVIVRPLVPFSTALIISQDARDRHGFECSRGRSRVRITYRWCTIRYRGKPLALMYGTQADFQEMNQTFSARTMWHSFICALVATFTLAVRPSVPPSLVECELIPVHGSFPYRKAGLVSSLLRSRLALLRATRFRPDWDLWCMSPSHICANLMKRVYTEH